MPAWQNQWTAKSRLLVRCLVTALLISSGLYGERRFESLGERWAWWLPPFGMTVVISIVLGWSMRLGQQRSAARRLPSKDQQSSIQAARSRVHLFQSKMDEVIQTLKGTAQDQQRRDALHTRPWYLVMGASGSGKTGLLEGLARLTPPVTRPPAHDATATSDCTWWVFPTAAFLDTCGRYTSSIPRTQEHDEWCSMLEFLHDARARQPLNGILLTVAADTLGVQPLEILRREAVMVRQRLHEARRALGREIPLYVLVTRCDLIEGFVGFFTHLPAYIRTQVFGWVHTARPPRNQRRHPLGVPVPGAQMSAMLTRRLDQLRLCVLHDARQTGRARQQLFCFPEEFRALQRRFCLFLDALCGREVPLDAPYVRGVFFCSAKQRGIPFSVLQDTLGFKTPSRALEESTRSYFLHDLVTVILPRDRHLARPATGLEASQKDQTPPD